MENSCLIHNGYLPFVCFGLGRCPLLRCNHHIKPKAGVPWNKLTVSLRFCKLALAQILFRESSQYFLQFFVHVFVLIRHVHRNYLLPAQFLRIPLLNAPQVFLFKAENDVSPADQSGRNLDPRVLLRSRRSNAVTVYSVKHIFSRKAPASVLAANK